MSKSSSEDRLQADFQKSGACGGECLPTVTLPEKFVDHWTIEAMRLHLLMDAAAIPPCDGGMPWTQRVLFRSLCFADTGDKSSARGDDVLVRYKARFFRPSVARNRRSRRRSLGGKTLGGKGR